MGKNSGGPDLELQVDTGSCLELLMYLARSYNIARRVVAGSRRHAQYWSDSPPLA
jgi:hypothetical protein